MGSLRKLSGIYIAAASAYAIAIFLAQNPDLARTAHQTGTVAMRLGGEAAIALNDRVLQPGWAAAQTQTVVLSQRPAEALQPAPVQLAQATRRATHRALPKSVTVAQSVKRVRIAKAPPQRRVAEIEKPAIQPEVLTSHAPTLRPQVSEPKPVEVARNTPSLAFKPQVDLEIAPQAVRPVAPHIAPPLVPQSQEAPLPPAASGTPPSPAELARVSDRLRDSLTRDMVDNFSLFLYVSKAENGPLAQRMYVFQKQGDGNLVMLYNWPVSTGRERVEHNDAGLRLPSYTPAGYYELDSRRLFTHYHSIQWNQPMPYAMFFNWVKNGSKTGLAIHAATGGDIGLLGTRASAGCVRLAPENARVLFTLIRTQYKGLVPKFDFDARTGTMSNDGILLHDAGGNLKMAEGYKVLVFIENFGGENTVAALF
ncbi:MAG TPA: L,D-transpeptidase family protein [Rhizomicrobium sp.]|nr:L,D-transpeptidase family protein [Rhizomicrobium sp.]